VVTKAGLTNLIEVVIKAGLTNLIEMVIKAGLTRATIKPALVTTSIKQYSQTCFTDHLY
jgi:hypothetical protein